MKPSVLCSVPLTKTGLLHHEVASWTSRFLADERYEIDVCYPTAEPSENCRAHAMREFLAGPYDFWLSIDSDNPPAGIVNGEERNPLELAELELDVVGVPTPVRQYDADQFPRCVWNVYAAVGEEYAWLPLAAGLQEVDAIGFGCVMFARRVLERLRWEQPFQRLWNRDGTQRLGSDLAFCRRAKAAGFRIWANWDYLSRHHTLEDALGTMQLLDLAKRQGREEHARRADGAALRREP